jgi:hypothetical protein
MKKFRRMQTDLQAFLTSAGQLPVLMAVARKTPAILWVEIRVDPRTGPEVMKKRISPASIWKRNLDHEARSRSTETG